MSAQPNLPAWPGAATCYQRAGRIAAAWARAAYAAQRARDPRKSFRMVPPQELLDLIAALNQGDEETIKDTISLNLSLALDPAND